MGTLCYDIVKYLVVLINFLVWLFGLGVLLVAIWMFIDPSFYVSMTQDYNDYYISASILLITGVLLVIVAFLGCCGAFRESQCMLVTFSCLLLIVLAVQIGCAIWMYINSDSLEPLVRSTMKTTVQDEYNEVPSRKTTFDTIQRGLECCGADRPSDWIKTKEVVMTISDSAMHYTIPESCCRAGISQQLCKESTKILKVGGEINTDIIYNEGCTNKVVGVIKDNAFIFIVVGLTVMLIQLIGLICSIILMVGISRSNRYKA